LLQLNDKEILDLLQAFPKLKLKPLSTPEIVFEGLIEDKVRYKDFEELEFIYKIRIVVPEQYPNELPDYFIIDESVTPDDDLHIQSKPYGKICLGVPLRLMMELNKAQTLSKYTENVLLPFLYGLTYKLKNGRFPFDTVGHYAPGRLEEYKKMLKLKDETAIIKAFEILCMENGNALFERCPCGCGKLYISCNYRNTLEQYRDLSSKQWYREEAKKIGRWYE